MTDEVDKTDWDRQRESLGWPSPYGEELEGLVVMTDSERMEKLRKLALGGALGGDLEAFVARYQLDFCRDEEQFNEILDEALIDLDRSEPDQIL